jgi:hypothetical protein
VRLTRVRIASQVFFFAAFVLAVWATWTIRLERLSGLGTAGAGSLVTMSTVLATGYIYRAARLGPDHHRDDLSVRAGVL